MPDAVRRNYKIALHRDKTPLASGRQQSFAARWEELAGAAGHEIVPVDAYAHDVLNSCRQCDAFMWYFWNAPHSSELGKRLIAAIHHGIGLPTFPSWHTIWTFEDKTSQRYLLDAAGIPYPKTWVFWARDAADAFADSAVYPLVLKLDAGITSRNVRLLSTPAQAHAWIERLFSDGASALYPDLPRTLRGRTRDRIENAARVLAGRRLKHHGGSRIQRGNILFQEFLPDNAFDTRVTVIGDRAFAFRRMNRPGDFRASGSGRIDWDPGQIDPAAIDLAFDVARVLDTQVVALDILKHCGQLLVNEVSYYYEAWAVHSCPGQWQKSGSGKRPQWIEGQMRPDDAIFAHFIQSLQREWGKPRLSS